MLNITCDKKCCKYSSIAYTSTEPISIFIRKKERHKKAGIFITTSDMKKVLLVQSKGQCWGPPKGSLNDNETIEDGALREVKEETGLTFTKEDLGEIKAIKGRSFYYHIKMIEQDIKVQTQILGNDANGVGWFNIDCLKELVDKDFIKINQHCRYLIKKILDIDVDSKFKKRLLENNFFK